MNRLVVVACLLSTGALVPCVHAAGRTCEQLAQLALPNTQITSSQPVAAGTFAPPEIAEPWMRADASFYKQLPAFCRVIAVAKPTADSDIRIEVWLPATGWNGKFRGQGNGAFAGSIDYRALGWAIEQGYATAATDTGHVANSGDCGYRKLHLALLSFAQTPRRLNFMHATCYTASLDVVDSNALPILTRHRCYPKCERA